jgi:hypothetical protein
MGGRLWPSTDLPQGSSVPGEEETLKIGNEKNLKHKT